MSNLNLDTPDRGGRTPGRAGSAVQARRAAASPEPPQLSVPLERVGLAELTHDSGYTEIALMDATLENQHASGVSLQTAQLTDGDLSGSRLEHLRLADSTFGSCNLANLQASRAYAARVHPGQSPDGNQPR